MDIIIRYSPKPLNGPAFWVVPHDVKRVDWNTKDFRYRGPGLSEPRNVVNASGVRIPAPPEVYRVDNHSTVLDCYWQNLWWWLNPMLSADKQSTLYGNHLAWTNNTGFPGSWNCLTGADRGAKFPRFDQCRTMGGAIHRGTLEGDTVHLESLMVNDHSWTAERLLNSPWMWYYATLASETGTIGIKKTLGIDNKLHEVKVPFITTIKVSLPANELVRLDPDTPWPGPQDII